MEWMGGKRRRADRNQNTKLELEPGTGPSRPSRAPTLSMSSYRSSATSVVSAVDPAAVAGEAVAGLAWALTTSGAPREGRSARPPRLPTPCGLGWKVDAGRWEGAEVEARGAPGAPAGATRAWPATANILGVNDLYLDLELYLFTSHTFPFLSRENAAS